MCASACVHSVREVRNDAVRVWSCGRPVAVPFSCRSETEARGANVLVQSRVVGSVCANADESPAARFSYTMSNLGREIAHQSNGDGAVKCRHPIPPAARAHGKGAAEYSRRTGIDLHHQCRRRASRCLSDGSARIFDALPCANGELPNSGARLAGKDVVLLMSQDEELLAPPLVAASCPLLQSCRAASHR